MNRKAKKTLGALFTAIAILAAVPMLFASGTSGWGAAGAKTDSSLSIESMLAYAIQDEYSARAEYAAIMAKFGERTPFSNIIRSEESHISWIRDEYAARGLAVPSDESASHLVIPASLKDAFSVGVQAEIDNIAMYDSFLASPLLAGAGNARTRDLFTRLRDASKNHLAAFRNGLSKF